MRTNVDDRYIEIKGSPSSRATAAKEIDCMSSSFFHRPSFPSRLLASRGGSKRQEKKQGEEDGLLGSVGWLNGRRALSFLVAQLIIYGHFVLFVLAWGSGAFSPSFLPRSLVQPVGQRRFAVGGRRPTTTTTKGVAWFSCSQPPSSPARPPGDIDTAYRNQRNTDCGWRRRSRGRDGGGTFQWSFREMSVSTTGVARPAAAATMQPPSLR